MAFARPQTGRDYATGRQRLPMIAGLTGLISWSAFAKSNSLLISLASWRIHRQKCGDRRSTLSHRVPPASLVMNLPPSVPRRSSYRGDDFKGLIPRCKRSGECRECLRSKRLALSSLIVPAIKIVSTCWLHFRHVFARDGAGDRRSVFS